ncbi:lipoprotein [Spiroplasma tabanidicola]|uniref:Lipoprotein n=1 Tax=Spiroplasma tabanidicola TaxID=324079 RepID=A0A6I6CJE3_9MOLU|nr:lipoprotein [Spiroplasma tabanidicola]QGS52193.1 hypothetical protein STABA_v1c08380 [Spiroplasma tabanidicola]
MKKLLTLLGSLTLVSSAANVAVACGTYDIKDNGNSVIVQFLNSLDGKAHIDASHVLVDLINASGPTNREAFLIEMLQLMNVSLLANSNTFFGAEGTLKLDESNTAYNKNLGETLSYRWDSLNKAVDQQIEREKETYKVKNGKKWESKWKDMLYEKYTVYQNKKKEMDLDFLEKKYKANILLTDTTNNATKAILDVLLNTDSYGVTWVTAQTVKNKLSKLLEVINDDAKFSSVYEADKNAVSQIINAQTMDSKNWKAPADLDVAAAKAAVRNITSDKIICDVPEDINQWVATSSNTRSGMLSNSQLFFLEKYFEIKAPLAISEITIPFATNGKFEDGISYEDFKGDFDVTAKDIDKLLVKLTPDKQEPLAESFWNEAARNSSKLNIGSIKKYDKLLTLQSTDFSDSLKNVVYDYVLGSEYEKPEELSFDGKDFEADIKKITNKLTRAESVGSPSLESRAAAASKGANVFYGTLKNNPGKLLYIDTDGMHIVSIDGYDQLKNKTENKFKDLTPLAQLQAFNDFHKLSDNQKIYYMQHDTETTSNSENRNYMNILNNSIKNNYLRYLVNNSLISGISDAPVSFDIVNELKSWVSVTSATDKETFWMTAVFDYFKNVTTKTKEDSNSLEDVEIFLKKLVVFGEENPTNKEFEEIAKSMQGWVASKIKVAQINISVAPQIAFSEKHTAWVKTIKSNTTTNYPKAVIENSNFSIEKIGGAIQKIWPAKGAIYTEGAAAISSPISMKSLLESDLIKNNFINSYLEAKKIGGKK